MEEIVSFLSQVPDPSGQPALQYVLSEWCNRHVRKLLYYVLASYGDVNGRVCSTTVKNTAKTTPLAYAKFSVHKVVADVLNFAYF